MEVGVPGRLGDRLADQLQGAPGAPALMIDEAEELERTRIARVLAQMALVGRLGPGEIARAMMGEPGLDQVLARRGRAYGWRPGATE